ncbi:MAG: APC family permease [Gammaproteobacteria bacterium]|nr:APC family permease [Gammaproteobacteria bacterium]
MDDRRIALKRDVGLTLFALYGAGNIIGAGIYVLVGKVAGEAGILAPFAFMVAAFIAIFTGLSYGELAARFPVSAGEAVYLHKAFNRRSLAMAVGLLIALAGLVSAATLANGFVGYFHVFIDGPAWLIILVLVAILTLVSARGIAESARVAAFLTIAEAGGLLWVIAVASPNFVHVADFALADVVPLDNAAWQGVLAGAFLAFFAFIGFEDMVNIAEEVKQPQRTIPLGIILAFGFSTVLYVLIAVVSMVTMPPAELAESDAPLAAVYTAATNRPALLLSLIGTVAVINGALIQIIMASRIFYGMSRNGWLPAALSVVHPRTHTPLRSTFLAGAIVLALALLLPLVSLAKTTSAMVLVVFTLVNLCLWRIKTRDPVPDGVRPVPLAVPVIGVVASLFILVVSL